MATVAAVCAAIGIAVAAVMMYVAWDHNPQGEFHELADDGSQLVHWWWWTSIGLSWFVAVFVVLFLIVGTATALAYRLRRSKSGG